MLLLANCGLLRASHCNISFHCITVLRYDVMYSAYGQQNVIICFVTIVISSSSPVPQHSDAYSMLLTSPLIQRPATFIQTPLQ